MAVSALFALVPEAEACVAHLRERFDPAARRGLGAHITVYYPVGPAESVSAKTRAAIGRVAASVTPFAFRLTHVARFPGTVYLAPKPASQFVRMHGKFAAVFHEPRAVTRQPYVPHLSVARREAGEEAAVETELAAYLHAHGPIMCRCRELALLENGTGLWRTVHVYSLGSADPARGRHPT